MLDLIAATHDTASHVDALMVVVVIRTDASWSAIGIAATTKTDRMVEHRVF